MGSKGEGGQDTNASLFVLHAGMGEGARIAFNSVSVINGRPHNEKMEIDVSRYSRSGHETYSTEEIQINDTTSADTPMKRVGMGL